jgi:hypothetical protein
MRGTTEPPANKSRLMRQLADQLITVFIVALLCLWLAATRSEVNVPVERGPWLPWLIASVLLFSWAVYRRKNIRWPKLRWVLPFAAVAFLWLMYLIIGLSFPTEFFIGLAIFFLICTALLLLALGLIKTRWGIKGKLGKAITWVTKQKDIYWPLSVLVVFASIFLGWKMLLDAGVGHCWTKLFLWGGILVFLVVCWVYLSTSHSESNRN